LRTSVAGARKSIHSISHGHVSTDDRRASTANSVRPAPTEPDAGGPASARVPAGDTAESLIRASMAMADAGNLHGAIESLRTLTARSPGNFLALGSLGTLEQRMGNPGEAEQAFRRALAIRPNHASTLQCLANALLLQNHFEQATPLYEKLLRQGDAPLGCKTALCRCYLQAGRWSQAAELCEQILTEQPYYAGCIAMRDIARRELGENVSEPGTVRSLISTGFTQPPRGFESISAFNHALVEQISARTDLVEDPRDKTTRKGSQTIDLMDRPEGSFAVLGSTIKSCAEAFLQMRAKVDHGGYWARPTRDLRLSLWGTVLKTGGHQEPHIHHTAWLSGVYYTRLPQSIDPDDPSRAGWIEFGQPPPRYPCRADYAIENVCPREGMLVLFPSYLFHRTIPLRGDGIRISFAFDVIVS